MLSIIQPKRPAFSGWSKIRQTLPHLEANGFPYEIWRHAQNGMLVISSVEVAAEHVGQPALGPAYHLSVSENGARCSSADALWTLAQFDLLEAGEDNHVPSSVARNFWRYVSDNLVGMKCECVDDEPAMVEDKGDFVWRGVTS